MKTMRDIFDLAPRGNSLMSLFDEPFARFPVMPRMKTDVLEDDKGYKVVVDLPGFKKEDINVSMENDILTISAESKKEVDEKAEGKYIHQERSVSSMSRQYRFGNIDSSAVKATFKDGVLEVALPKKEPENTASKIEIE